AANKQNLLWMGDFTIKLSLVIEAFLITYKIDITILRMRKEILIATLLFLYFSGMIAFAMAEGTFISDSTYSHIEYEQHSYFRFADSLGANKKMFEAVAA